MEKWPSGLEDVLTHIPMLVRMPGGKAGVVAQGAITTFDIVPTILELANIAPNHTHFAVSMVPVLKGDPEPPDRLNRPVFAEGGYGTFEPHCFEGYTGLGNPGQIYYPKLLQQQKKPLSVTRTVMVRTPTHKLVLRSDPQSQDHDSELYDLAKDPREITNVYGNADYQNETLHLKDVLLRWFIQTSDQTPLHSNPRGFPPGQRP